MTHFYLSEITGNIFPVSRNFKVTFHQYLRGVQAFRTDPKGLFSTCLIGGSRLGAFATHSDDPLSGASIGQPENPIQDGQHQTDPLGINCTGGSFLGLPIYRNDLLSAPVVGFMIPHSYHISTCLFFIEAKDKKRTVCFISV